ncbi:MAG: diaminopimelate epimerase [Firmicutes bacterium]|nr:diaminopimelate epimerase [Bacillota bacterium]
MKFTKMHGLGNDFIVIENFDLALTNVAALARQLCHRNFGVGADGLVLLQPSKIAQFCIRIINSDGTEAEMCGNALRCIGKYLYERKLSKKKVIAMEMFHSLKILRLQLDAQNRVATVEVDMGEPILESHLVPVSGVRRRVVGEAISAIGETFSMTAVSMGNPHCVIFCQDTEVVPLALWGPALESHESFPKKTNVEFVEIISPTEASFRVWERGSGPTLACGSGACAVLVAGVLNGKLERQATLHLPGGSLRIEWREDNHLYMSGPATEVFQGEVSQLLTNEGECCSNEDTNKSSRQN